MGKKIKLSTHPLIQFFTNREKVGERQAGLVFYDKSDLNIAKSKKSEQYIHENSDEHFAPHCESH